MDSNYRADYLKEIILKNGSRVALRPMRPEDEPHWLNFVYRIGENVRFFNAEYTAPVTEQSTRQFAAFDYINSVTLIAESQGNIVAAGRYQRLPGNPSARFAIIVDQNYQGQGLGSEILGHLVFIARAHKIATFEADLPQNNQQVLSLLKGYAFHIAGEPNTSTVRVSFPVSPSPRAEHREAERQRLATIASLRPLLQPAGVAIIGASRHPDSIGRRIFKAVLEASFAGTVYPVNPKAESILGIKTYPTVLDVPGKVDMAVIVVPAQLVALVASQCGQKGVKSIVVISDGFRERGPEGATREKELSDIALSYGMRLVGPNCMGVINSDNSTRLNATFSLDYPRSGNVAFLSQSGAMGMVILEYAHDVNLGISNFVSIGNRADVSPNDLLQYWEQDPATDVILLYLESFGNPMNFSRIARRVSRKKPIAVVKGGITAAGSRAASSHTGAMATPMVVSDALFHQTGIMRVGTVEELFDLGLLLSNQPTPKGRRVAILTNGGGPGILAADACAQHGLVLPELSTATRDKLKSLLKREASLNNPIDVTAGATAAEFEAVLRVLAEDGDNDAVFTIFVPPVVIDTADMEETVKRVSVLYHRLRKPLLACFIGQRGIMGSLGNANHFVPCFLFPEEAIAALAHAAEHGEFLRRPQGKVVHFLGIKQAEARKLIDKAMLSREERPFWLSNPEVAALLDYYGIRTVKTAFAATATEAAREAARLGFPVVVKLNSGTITHKTEVGGVVLNLASEAEVKRAFDEIRARLAVLSREREMDGVIIQPMLSTGVETIVGVTQDPSFGPLISFGMGGVLTELLQEVALKLYPLTDIDADELIAETKTAKLLEGYRGAPPSDLPALKELLLRLSAMVGDLPQIAELDMNPVRVLPLGQGCRVLDARILLK
jgi:acetate---CoA ligase (ADP-forming)